MLKIINARKRKLTDEDFRRLAEIEEHPEVARWDIPAFGGDVERAFAAFKKSNKSLSKRGDEFLVAIINEKVVGFAGIHRLRGEIGEMRHVGEVGVMVHHEFQRRGVGTKLLRAAIKLAEKRGFRRLEGDTLANNTAMRHTLEKTGFTLEGFRRKRIKIESRYHDEACYAILLS